VQLIDCTKNNSLIALKSGNNPVETRCNNAR
jgi:hypothetical protein